MTRNNAVKRRIKKEAMRYKRIRAACIVLWVVLTLSACSSVEDLPLEHGAAKEDAVTRETTTTAPPVSSTTTQQTADTQQQEESVTTTADDKPETVIKTDETTKTEVTDAVISDNSERLGSVGDDYREWGENGILVIGRNGHYMGLMPCWGTYELCDNYTEQVEKAAKSLPKVNVYNMTVPTSVEYYLPDDVTGFTASQKNKIEYIGENLKSVKNVDVWDVLYAHREEPIYSRTDHHWQPLGAYYAAEEFARAAGVEKLFPPLSEYKQVVRDDYMGSMYNYSKSANLYNDPEPFALYISPNADALKTTYYDTAFQGGYESDLFVTRDAGAFYCSFLGSDDRIAEIETDCKNGKTLVICKESYGNGMVPFLTSCYERIYVVDLRFFDLNLIDFCKNVGATDLLFAMCTFTPAGVNCKYMNDIIR